MAHEFQTPEAVAIIGGREYRPVSVTTYASRQHPIARAELEISPEDVDWRSLGDAECQVQLGWDGRYWLPFGGRIELVVPDNPIRVVALDAVQRLKKAVITTALVRPTLRDVLETVFDQVGISSWVAAPNAYQCRVFVARSISGTKVLEACRDTFGVPDWDFFATPEGTLIFGPWETSERAGVAPVMALRRNDNIDDLVPDARGGRVTTNLAPWVRHGHRVTIEDGEVAGVKIVARVERVIHRFNAVDGGQTELQWTPV